jgi:hypothetical protein
MMNPLFEKLCSLFKYFLHRRFLSLGQGEFARFPRKVGSVLAYSAKDLCRDELFGLRTGKYSYMQLCMVQSTSSHLDSVWLTTHSICTSLYFINTIAND